MAIDSNNEKLALITYHQPFNTPIPTSDDELDQADNQHLLWEYPGILWSELEEEEAKTLKEVFYEILSDDAQINSPTNLGGLLGQFSTAPYGVVFLSPPTKPTLPLIVYYVISESGRMPRDVLVGVGVWGGDVTTIHKRVRQLLHNINLGEIVGGRALTCKWNWAGPDVFDEDLRAYARMERYLVKEAKN